MLSFEDYLNENFTSGISNNIKPLVTVGRNELPQIDDVESFVVDMLENNINYRNESVSHDSLLPTQNEFNAQKINKIASLKSDLYPIFVSNDNYIIDGHHRWKASIKNNVNTNINRISINYLEFKKFIKNKKYVSYKKINEDITHEFTAS